MNQSDQQNHLVENFFRHESANLIAVLTRVFGVRQIELVEDTVQSAMLEAMRSWKQKGPPENPSAWIHRVARNRILDHLRRDKVHERALAFAGHTIEDTESLVDQWLTEEELPDSLLRMIFVCCHPALPRSSQIALTLQILCGFGIEEISRALLTPAETIKKRIQRAKKKLAELRIAVETPAPSELASRLNSVHDVLYLAFNEGYSSSRGPAPIRDDLCEEAARLCHILSTNPPFDTPTSRALIALMLFHGARLEARVDEHGDPVLLEDQNREDWDRPLIQVANNWFHQSATEHLSRFHFEAAIAQQHCRAASFEETDWDTIVKIYDRLIKYYDSPIYQLNRAIARGQSGDTTLATKELNQLAQHPSMENYFLVECARGKLFELEGNSTAAVDCYLRAINGRVAEHEKNLLKKKIKALTTADITE
jgi:RNA polymerase sigma-70 factor (ECF subfamily)